MHFFPAVLSSLYDIPSTLCNLPAAVMRRLANEASQALIRLNLWRANDGPNPRSWRFFLNGFSVQIIPPVDRRTSRPYPSIRRALTYLGEVWCSLSIHDGTEKSDGATWCYMVFVQFIIIIFQQRWSVSFELYNSPTSLKHRHEKERAHAGNRIKSLAIEGRFADEF